MPDCLFCKIAAKQIPSTIVYEDENLLAFRDISPAAPSHVLIIPKKHVAAIMDVSGDDAIWWKELPAVIQKIAKKEKVDATGFRLALNNGADAGQAVAHLHFHLLGGRKMAWPPG